MAWKSNGYSSLDEHWIHVPCRENRQTEGAQLESVLVLQLVRRVGVWEKRCTDGGARMPSST
jgi:hypothetical protein